MRYGHLRYAFLRDAYLRYAYSRYGYLRYGYSRYVYLRDGYLRYASFRDGHLQNRLVAIQLWIYLQVFSHHIWEYHSSQIRLIRL